MALKKNWGSQVSHSSIGGSYCVFLSLLDLGVFRVLFGFTIIVELLALVATDQRVTPAKQTWGGDGFFQSTKRADCSKV